MMKSNTNSAKTERTQIFLILKYIHLMGSFLDVTTRENEFSNMVCGISNM